MGRGLQEVFATVAAQGLTPTGPWLTHHYGMTPESFDFEICLPVPTPVTASGRVLPGELGAMRVARTVYRGGFEGLGDAWGELDAWVAATGLVAAPDLIERYLAGPESSDNPADWRTELIRPLLAG